MRFIKRLWQYLRKRKKLSIALIIVIILAFIFWPRPPKPIETQDVKKADVVESVSTNGTVFSNSSVNLTFLSGGKLVYLGAKKGEDVLIR